MNITYGKTTNGTYVANIPSDGATFRVRKNRDGWKGTIAIAGMKLADVYETSPAMNWAFVEKDFTMWALNVLSRHGD